MADNSEGRRPFVDPIHTSVFDLVTSAELYGRLSPRHAAEIEALLERRRGQLESLALFSIDAAKSTSLSAQRQRELAALTIDIDEQYHAWRASEDYFRRLKKRASRGGHVRELARALAKVRHQLLQIVEQSKEVDMGYFEVLHHQLRIAIQAVEVAAERLIPRGESPEAYTQRLASWPGVVASTHPQPIDPKADGAVRLVRHLRDQVGLRAQDAYVVAARLGNELWTWGYAIEPNDFGEPDCPGIRKLVARHSPPTRPSARGQTRKRIVKGRPQK